MIIPEEAVIVKRMFQLYLESVPLQSICDDLNDAGYRSINGKLFQEASINALLHNEIYAGDLRRQKCYMADPITKNKVKNRGELRQYYMADCHEAIIDRETYALVEQEFERRAAMLNPTYCFTGKMVCGVCGRPFTRKKCTTKGKLYVKWICRAKKEVSVTCESRNYNENELKNICAETLGMTEFDEVQFENTVKQMVVLKDGSIGFQLVGGETRKWKDLQLSPNHHVPTLTECFKGKIICGKCGETYHRVNSANTKVYWFCIGKKRKGSTCNATNYADFRLRIISAYILGLEEFDEDVFEKQIEKITVLDDGSLEYQFYEGRTEIW